MHRIDDEFSLPDGNGSGKAGFTEGDPVAGMPATRLRAEWLNAVQEEVANAVEESGIELDKNDNTQLRQAIQRLRRADLADLALANWLMAGVAGALVSVARVDHGVLLTVTDAGVVSMSLGGESWTDSEPLPSGISWVTDIAGYTDQSWVVVGAAGYIAETQDAGNSWSRPNLVGVGDIDFACITAGAAGRNPAYVAVGTDFQLAQGAAVRRTIGGAWALALLPLDHVRSVVWADTHLKFYASGTKDGRGIVVSSADGQDWAEEFKSSKSGRVEDLCYDRETDQVIAVGERAGAGALWWKGLQGGWNVAAEPWGPGAARVGWNVAANAGLVVVAVSGGGPRAILTGRIGGEWVERVGAGRGMNNTPTPRWLGGRWGMIDELSQLRLSLWSS